MDKFLELKQPGPSSYEQDDRVLHAKLRDQNFGKIRIKLASNERQLARLSEEG